MPIVITAIRMEGGETDLDITHLWWENPETGYSDCSALETIISYIEDLKGKAYVRDDEGYVIRVVVMVPESGPKFLSTYGDREWTDHLSSSSAPARAGVGRDGSQIGIGRRRHAVDIEDGSGGARSNGRRPNRTVAVRAVARGAGIIVGADAVRYKVYWRDGRDTLRWHARRELTVPRLDYGDGLMRPSAGNARANDVSES